MDNDFAALRAHFDRCLTLDPSQRGDYFAEQGLAPPQRARVEAMLRANESDCALLDRGAEAALRSMAAAAAATHVAPPRSDRFEVIRELGRGGMGAVYLARQRTPSRLVALKRIGGEPSPALLERFRTEADALARLQHAGIAAVHGFEHDDGGDPFLVMEYVDGYPLEEFAARLPVPQKLSLLAAIADAVDHAHSRGVVHRDLKPGNVLVTHDGQPKVLDFGIARLSEGAVSSLTQDGTLLGTPAYMSPEQAAGAPASPASDLHALGVISYELLAGRKPVSVSGLSPLQVLRAIAHETAPPLSRIVPALRGDLDAVFAMALAKQPEARYPSAAAFADDLRRVLAHEPVRARRAAWRRRAVLYLRRHRAGVAAAAAVALVALAGVAATLQQAANARREAETADAVRRTLTGIFVGADPNENGGRAPSVREVLDLGVDRVANDPSLAADVRVPLLSDLGAVYSSLGEDARALDVFGHARGAAGEARGGAEVARLELRAAQSLVALARHDEAAQRLAAARVALPQRDVEGALGTEIEIAAAGLDEARDRMPEAQQRLEALLARLDAAVPPRPLERAEALHALGTLALARADPKRGVDFLRQGLEQLRAAGVGPVEQAMAQGDLATALRSDGRATEAEPLMREAYESLRALLGDTHPATLTAHGEYATVLHDVVKPAEARAAFAATLAGNEQRFGSGHPRVALAANNFGVYWYGEREFQAAADLFERAWRIWERELGPTHERTLQARGNLAGAWTELGRLHEARPALDALVAARRERGAWPTLMSSLVTRGLLLEKLGEVEAAGADYAEALALGRENDPGNQAQWVWPQVLLARTERRRGDIAAARARLEDAVAWYAQPIYKEGGPRVSTGLLELARVVATEDPARAVALAQRSVEMRVRRIGPDHAETREAREELARLQRAAGAR